MFIQCSCITNNCFYSFINCIPKSQSVMNPQLYCTDNDQVSILLRTKELDIGNTETTQLDSRLAREAISAPTSSASSCSCTHTAALPKRKKRSKRRRRSKKNKPSKIRQRQELESEQTAETMETTETTETAQTRQTTESEEAMDCVQINQAIGDYGVKFPFDEIENFYLYNLASPGWTTKQIFKFQPHAIANSNEECVKYGLLSAGYLRNMEMILGVCIPKKIVQKITKLNLSVKENHCYNNHTTAVDDNSFLIDSEFSKNVLDLELGINSDSLTPSPTKQMEYSLTPSPTVSCITPFEYNNNCNGNGQFIYNHSHNTQAMAAMPPIQIPAMPPMHMHHHRYLNSDYSPNKEYFAYQSPPQVAKYACAILPAPAPVAIAPHVPLPLPVAAKLESEQHINFKSMDVGCILSLKFGIKELIDCNLICRLMKDQYGSRYLQNILKSYNSRECVDVITLVIHHLVSNNIDLTLMSEDIYGNYLIQLFFVRGTDLHHELLFNYFVYPSTLRLCKSKYGCRVIQKILSSVKNINRLMKLVECFRKKTIQSINTNTNSNSKVSPDGGSNSIHECLLCCNTNHVIQAMIELKLPYKAMKFIGDALERNLVSYSENVYACRVVQAFVGVYADKLDVNRLFLNDSHLFLSQVKYGNYVIQCIIKKDEWYSNLSEINKFRNQLINDVFNGGNILYLSKDKHGSNVIETCIKVANEKQIDNLIHIICSKQGFLLKQMIADKFGNYIPKTLLDNCQTKRQRRILVNTIHSYITNLYQYYHEFRHCAEFIEKCQKIKYDMDEEYDCKHNAHNIASYNKSRLNYY